MGSACATGIPFSHADPESTARKYASGIIEHQAKAGYQFPTKLDLAEVKELKLPAKPYIPWFDKVRHSSKDVMPRVYVPISLVSLQAYSRRRGVEAGEIRTPHIRAFMDELSFKGRSGELVFTNCDLVEKV